MQHDEVTALVDVTLERDLLLLGGVGLSPQPVLDVDGPVDNGGLAADGVGEAGAHAGALGAEGGTEVRGSEAVELGLHGFDVLVVLPVDGGVVGEGLHLRVGEGVHGELVAGSHHLLVDVGQVGALVEEWCADGEEGDLDVLLADDLEDFLGEIWDTVVDGESERVGALASEDKVTGRVLLGDDSASRNGRDDLND